MKNRLIEVVFKFKYSIVLFLGAASVAARIYLYPGTLSCYYRFNDCDFCYLMSAVRLLSGMPITYLDHPGYPMSQLLALFYDVMARLHIFSLPGVNYDALASSPNLFGYLRVLVWSGWFFNALLFLLMGFIVYQFVYYFSKKQLIGLFAGVAIYLSFSTYQFIYKIRPELLSMVLGMSSLYLLIRSMDMEDDRWFVLTFVSSIVLLVQATLTKIILIPLSLFLLIPIILMRGKGILKVSRGGLIGLGILNILLFPSTYGLFYWGLQGITDSKIFLVRLIPIIYLIVPLFISFLRYWRHEPIKLQPGWILIILKNSLMFFLLFTAGFEVSVQLSLLPSLYWAKDFHGIFENTMSAYRAYTNFELFILLGANGFNPQLIHSNFWQSIDWNFLQIPLSYLVSNRWLEISFIFIVCIIFWKKYKAHFVWSLFFLVLGIFLICFSSLRALEPQYRLYEEVPIIISAAICMGCLLDEIRRSGPGLQKKFVQIPLLAIIILGMFVLRMMPLINIDSQLACPYNFGNGVEGNLVCLCDPYGNSVGLKSIIEDRTGLTCREAVIEEFGLAH